MIAEGSDMNQIVLPPTPSPVLPCKLAPKRVKTPVLQRACVVLLLLLLLRLLLLLLPTTTTSYYYYYYCYYYYYY